MEGMLINSSSLNCRLNCEDFDDGGISTSGWTNNFSYPWIHDSQIYYSDDFALSSSNSTHNTNSILTLNLNVTAQSDLQFMKKVSSESGYDYLKFFIDNVEMDSWSGEDDWSLETYSINLERTNLNGIMLRILVLVQVQMRHGLMT